MLLLVVGKKHTLRPKINLDSRSLVSQCNSNRIQSSYLVNQVTYRIPGTLSGRNLTSFDFDIYCIAHSYPVTRPSVSLSMRRTCIRCLDIRRMCTRVPKASGASCGIVVAEPQQNMDQLECSFLYGIYKIDIVT